MNFQDLSFSLSLSHISETTEPFKRVQEATIDFRMLNQIANNVWLITLYPDEWMVSEESRGFCDGNRRSGALQLNEREAASRIVNSPPSATVTIHPLIAIKPYYFTNFKYQPYRTFVTNRPLSLFSSDPFPPLPPLPFTTSLIRGWSTINQKRRSLKPRVREFYRSTQRGGGLGRHCRRGDFSRNFVNRNQHPHHDRQRATNQGSNHPHSLSLFSTLSNVRQLVNCRYKQGCFRAEAPETPCPLSFDR